ncbi:MAG: hypothetical protein WDW36_000053 [Sanguina aurantia]
MRGLGADSRRPKPASGAQPQGWVLLDLAPALDPPPSQKPSWPAQIRKWSICKVLASFTRQHSARMPAQLAMSRTFHHTSQTTMAHPVELQGRLTSETLDYLHKDCHGVPRPAHWVPEHDAQRSPHRERSHRVHTLMTDPSSSHAAMALSCLTIATIVASTAAFVFESVPTYADVPDARLLFLWVDLLSVQIFAADYVVRWVQHTRVQPAVGGQARCGGI